MSLLSIPLLPECKIRKPPLESRQRPDKKITVRNMLRIPRIWFSFTTFIVATACNGFLSVNLEPQVSPMVPWLINQVTLNGLHCAMS